MCRAASYSGSGCLCRRAAHLLRFEHSRLQQPLPLVCLSLLRALLGVALVPVPSLPVRPLARLGACTHSHMQPSMQAHPHKVTRKRKRRLARSMLHVIQCMRHQWTQRIAASRGSQ